MDNFFFSLQFVNKKKLVFLIVLISFAVFLELLSLASILPIFSILLNNESIEIIFLSSLLDRIREISFFKFAPNLLFIILFLYILKTLYLYFIVYYQSKFSLDIQLKFADKLLELYQNQNYLTYLQSNSSELLRNVYSEIALFVKYLILPIIVITTELIILFTILIFISFLNLKFLVIIFFIFLSTGLLYFTYFGKKLKAWGDKRLENDKNRIEYLQYNLFGHKEIVLSQKQKYFRNKYNEFNYLSGINNLYSSVLAQLPRYFLETIIITIILIFIISSLLTNSNMVSVIPILTVFFGAFYRILPSINRIYQSIQNIKFGFPVFKKITGEFKRIKFRENNNSEFKFNNKIKFNNIKFNYPNKKKLLDEVTLEINRGECVGIIGESGSGKSTFLNILMGLINPISGKIEIDGEIKNLNSNNWYKKISHIPQDIFLLNDTIRNNICFGSNSKDYEDKKIIQIINQVKLNKYLEDQPRGLDTNIGENGSQISGGEKQRLALARALFKQSDILVFDEATSSLDQENEIAILKLIESLKKDKTIIMISHNANLINFCDTIYKVIDGKILIQK